MTKQELAKYAGHKVYALCWRMGGIGRDIQCLTVYKITERGTMLYECEVMPIVANKAQCEALEHLTHGHYVLGRPTADKINADEIEALINA